jgi:hypothetical protein
LRNGKSLNERARIAKFQRAGTILGFPPENERPFHRQGGGNVGTQGLSTQEVYITTKQLGSGTTIRERLALGAEGRQLHPLQR